MPIQKKPPAWEAIFQTIQKSYAIARHYDFYQWLRTDIHTLMPHDMLISVWGDFAQGELKYDVTSHLHGLDTQALYDNTASVQQLMCQLHRRWQLEQEKWFIVDQFDGHHLHLQSPTEFTKNMSAMHALLVYGVKDVRGKSDCLYVFFTHHYRFTPPYQLLGMLMPHLDAAMRRIGYLEPNTPDDGLLDKLTLGGLSEREQEILHWVRLGKTNLEIGMILHISANTVKNHLKRIFHKLDVTCRAQAVAKTSQQYTLAA